MKVLWKRSLFIHPDLEGFQTLDMRRRREVISEWSSINSMGGFFDSVENIRRPSEMNKMCEVILLGSAWKADVDFDDVWFRFGGNKEIDSKIHKNKNPLQTPGKKFRGG